MTGEDVEPGAQDSGGAQETHGAQVLPGASVSPGVPEPGTFAVDARDGRVGRVMGSVGPYVQLRAPGGGAEWDCPPHLVRAAPPGLVLRARVTEVNREGRLPR